MSWTGQEQFKATFFRLQEANKRVPKKGPKKGPKKEGGRESGADPGGRGFGESKLKFGREGTAIAMSRASGPLEKKTLPCTAAAGQTLCGRILKGFAPCRRPPSRWQLAASLLTSSS